MWLEYGPETARRWAELTGLDTPAVRFSDPAKQEALEKAIKESSKAKSNSTGKQPNPKAEGPAPKKRRSGQSWIAGAECHKCGGIGHLSSECPSEGGASGKGLRPPMP